ncbi:MAG TPA: CPBP family intramembrane glutamic endopeptidase [Chitinophagaceae bacterium]
MLKVAGYIRDYFIGVNKGIFCISTLFTALLVFINYNWELNDRINALEGERQYLGWYFLFLLAFSFVYLLGALSGESMVFRNWRFVLLLLLAPAIFAWKMSFDFTLPLASEWRENAYWNRVIYWPLKLTGLTFALWIAWKLFDRRQPFYGFSSKDFSLKPYLLMLLIMVPLIAAASTQPDFLAMYPKFKNVGFLTEDRSSGWYKVLYELSYGIDFVGIELFFRGFLVLAFVKWVGKDAILPMAIFYCTIHFGKPLGECISSFFGGIILGVVTYHTRSILGGLIVHLGIAWLMELGGYLGRHLELVS